MAKIKFGNLILYFGLALLFFLPIVESLNRTFGLILLFLSGILFGINIIFEKNIKFNKLEILFLIIITLFSISTITSISFHNSVVECTRYISYFLIFISFRRMFHIKNLLMKFTFAMVLTNSIILSMISILYRVPNVGLQIPYHGMNLYYAVFGHNRLSDILVFAIPISMGLTIYMRDRIVRYIFMIITIFFTLNLFLSFGRGAILSLALALIIVIIFSKKYFIAKQWINGAFVIGMVGIIFISFVFVYSNFSHLLSKDIIEIRGLYKPVYYNYRLLYFSQAVKGMLQSPFLGTGLDTFRFISLKNRKTDNFSRSWYVHNHYLQIISETGVISGLIFIYSIILIILNSYNNIGRNNINLPLGIFIGMLASSIQSLFDFNWQFYSIFLIFWIESAVLLNTKYPN